MVKSVPTLDKISIVYDVSTFTTITTFLFKKSNYQIIPRVGDEKFEVDIKEDSKEEIWKDISKSAMKEIHKPKSKFNTGKKYVINLHSLLYFS
jgi:hypothetical protein